MIFGRKTKHKSGVLFSIGFLLPVIILLPMVDLFSYSNSGFLWISNTIALSIVFLILLIIVGVGVGYLFVRFPKLGLGGLGATVGFVIGLFIDCIT